MLRARDDSSSGERFVFTLMYVLLVVVYCISLFAPGVALWGDDGTYVVTAKAVAEGHGYRIISFPNEPPQTKYPVVFPALLAFVWRMFPNFPENSLPLKLIPLAAGVLWFLQTRKLMAQGLSARVAAPWIALIVAASPLTVFLTTSLLSDIPFAAFSTASLVWLRRAESDIKLRASLIGALFAALAFNTRTAGIALIAAAFVALLLRQKFRAAIVFGGTCFTLCLPWTIWQVTHMTASGYNSWVPYYRSWNILLNFSVSEKLSVIRDNLTYVIIAPYSFFGMPYNMLALVACILISMLTIFGFLYDLRRGLNVVHIYVVAYCGMLLLWAFPPFRFLSAVTPLMIYFAYCGVRAIGWTASMVGPRIVCCGLCLTLAFSLMAQSRRTMDLGVVTTSGFDTTIRWPEFVNAMNRISQNTGEQERLLGKFDSAFYLFTGRKAIPGFEPDPMDLYSPRHKAPVEEVKPLAARMAAQRITQIVLLPSTTDYQVAVAAAFEAQCPAAICREILLGPGYRLISIQVDQSARTNRYFR